MPIQWTRYFNIVLNSDSFSPSLDSLPLLDVTSDLEEFFRKYKNKTHLYDQSTDEPDLKVDDLPLPYYENYQMKKIEHDESDDEVESELSNLFPYYNELFENETDQTGDEQIKQERSATELNIDEILRQIVSDDHDADLDFNIDSDDHILLPFYDWWRHSSEIHF